MQALQLKPQIKVKNILFATDFEAPAIRALPFAVAMARHYGAKLHLSHVVPYEAYALASPDLANRILKDAEDFAGYTLNQVVIPLQHQGLDCDALFGDGNVTDVIKAFVANCSADLVVVGTSSRAGLGKMLLGSVAEEMIRSLPCPVLTVGPQVKTLASGGIHSVLCPVDFSATSVRAVGLASRLAQENQAHLTLVHVLETKPASSVHLAVQVTEHRLLDLVPEESELPYEPELVVEMGAIGERIVNLASDLVADLIVMGARGSGAFAQSASRLGSLVHKVVALAPCPVLTVGDAGKSDAN